MMGKTIKDISAPPDDPMFTGRFHVHYVRLKDSGQRKKKKDRLIGNEKNSKKNRN